VPFLAIVAARWQVQAEFDVAKCWSSEPGMTHSSIGRIDTPIVPPWIGRETNYLHQSEVKMTGSRLNVHIREIPNVGDAIEDAGRRDRARQGAT
jgi:hypothetical protein